MFWSCFASGDFGTWQLEFGISSRAGLDASELQVPHKSKYVDMEGWQCTKETHAFTKDRNEICESILSPRSEWQEG